MALWVIPSAETSNFALGTDPHRARPPNHRPRRLFALLYRNGSQERNHRFWRNATNQSTLFYVEQHLPKRFGGLDALQSPFYSNEKR